MVNKDKYLELAKKASLRHDIAIREAEQSVVRWEYAAWKRYDLTPYWFERKLEPRGPLLQEPEAAAIAYGYDIHEQLCFIKSPYLLECIERSENRVVNVQYRNGTVDSIEELIFDNGSPVSYVEFVVRNGMETGREWHFEEEYVYDNGQLSTIIRNEYWQSGTVHREHTFHLNDTQQGNLDSIHNENGELLYQSMSSAEAAVLRAQLKTELVEATTLLLIQMGEKLRTHHESVCFVCIGLHDEPHAIIQPILQPGLQRIRDKQLIENSDIWTLWNAGEHPVQYQGMVEDRELKARFHLLVQYWQVNANWLEEGKALWQEVTLELNQRSWSDDMPVTDDFIIFADDESINVAGGDLVHSVPVDKLVLLEKGKLLG